jgi:thymidylate synthase (FAD)
MKVELLHVTPLDIAIHAIRKCYDSEEKSDSYWTSENSICHENEFFLGEKDKKLIKQIIASGHTSTIEHLNFSFELAGYSRALLQEKSRHRIASVSERSTRYCLHQLKTAPCFYISLGIGRDQFNYQEAEKYLIMTGIEQVDKASIMALENLRLCIVAGISNDKAKFCLPDSLQSECIFTINARSLRNWFHLRTNKRAMWEIRKLAYKMFDVIPEVYKFIFEDCIFEYGKDIQYGDLINTSSV